MAESSAEKTAQHLQGIPGRQPAATGRRWWQPIVRFGTHGTVSTAIFAIIFIPAVLLNLGVKFMEEHPSISLWLCHAATAAEIVLVAVDFTLYVAFLGISGSTAVV